MIAFTGVFLAVILRDTSIHPLVAFVLVLAITISFGAAMGAMIHYLEMPPFIVTLAGMFLARGAPMYCRPTAYRSPMSSTTHCSRFTGRLRAADVSGSPA